MSDSALLSSLKRQRLLSLNSCRVPSRLESYGIVQSRDCS